MCNPFFGTINYVFHIIILEGETLNFSDNFFKRVEKKTSVDKGTILDLAKKLQDTDLKNENTLREIIQTLGNITGREISKERENKIIKAVVNDEVPKNIDKMI